MNGITSNIPTRLHKLVFPVSFAFFLFSQFSTSSFIFYKTIYSLKFHIISSKNNIHANICNYLIYHYTNLGVSLEKEARGSPPFPQQMLHLPPLKQSLKRKKTKVSFDKRRFKKLIKCDIKDLKIEVQRI